jgi:ribosome maturation factor RimP
MASIDELKPAIEEKLRNLGFELFDLRFLNAGSRSILRITIDSTEGISIENCETVSHELSVFLDEAEFSPNRQYSLEVSSPGIDRPLKTERDFKRIKGRNVIVHLTNAVEGKKTLQGDVVSCENNILSLNIDEKTVEIPLSNIYSGKEEIRFK